MIVCSCHAVSDRALTRHIAEGAHTVEALGRACGAGTDCGSCVRELLDHLHAHRACRQGAEADDEREELAAK